jgi:photosystem II stability/assembly factor-like uncharacterized protein
VSEAKGWAVGEQGLIKTTSDSGNTWTTQTSGITTTLHSVHFATPLKGWAVGAQGKILATTDGGATWTAQASGTTSQLNEIYFISPTEGWTVAGNGMVMTTTDGGANWVAGSSGTTTWLESIFMTSATQGWACGNNGTILRYTAPVSVKEAGSKTRASIYPNPTSNLLTVQTDEKIESISVYNAMGALVQTETKNTFSVVQLPAGMYMLYIRTGNGNSTGRFIKE